MRLHNNREGLSFTSANQEAVEDFDETVKRYLQFHTDIGSALKSTLSHDPQMPMALCLRGYFYLLMGMRPLVDKARQLAEALDSQRSSYTEREQKHIDALGCWTKDSLCSATKHWEEIAQTYPRDILAIKMAHFGYFYLGRSSDIRDGIADAIDHWLDSDALYPYMLSMMAFGLVEAGLLRKAEDFGKRALKLTPNDPWGVHAVAHALETTERKAEVIDWISKHEEYWSKANNFRYHIHWHRALVHLEQGNYQSALDWYDRTVTTENSVEYLDICNEASLLMRLELCAVDLDDRWLSVANKASERINDQVMGFADVHYMMALCSSRLSEHHKLAQTLMENIQRYSESGTDNAQAYRLAVVPLARALLLFRNEQYTECAETLLDCAPTTHTAGGSHDQRDIYNYLAAEALFRSDPTNPRTISYLARRSFQAPYNQHNWKLYLQALRLTNQRQALSKARERCTTTAHFDLLEE